MGRNRGGSFGPWWPVGSVVRFLGRHGGHDLEDALKVMKEGDIFTVESSRTYGFSSDATFTEIDGCWNTVMFERI